MLAQSWSLEIHIFSEEPCFIQAQESMDDWATGIKAVRPAIQGNMATVVVVLGATEETRRRLALTLTRADGDWKICTVRLA